MKKQSVSLDRTISLPGPAASARLMVCPDLHDLSEKAADLVQSSVVQNPFALVLSGGSTPRAVHEVLSKRDLDWQKIHFFWGDERCVPPDHHESNYRMARETILERIPVSESQIHRMHGEEPPETAALDYETDIRAFFSVDKGFPSFPFVFLGLGEDCHTASLFPDTPAVNTMDRLIVSNYVEKLHSTRLTMTIPVFQAANRVVFLICGASKAAALKTVLQGPYDPQKYPAQSIRPSGELYFIVDRAASNLLDVV